MHGIGEQHGFVIAEAVEQFFISRDESLLGRISLPWFAKIMGDIGATTQTPKWSSIVMDTGCRC
jgi:hypothetical protein